MTTAMDMVEKRYGEAVKTQIQHVWEQQAFPGRDQDAYHFFLQLRETSPQGPECETCEDCDDKHMLNMVCKLILYAPQEWFSIVTGVQACPESTQNDFKNIGVAFDASSRLRRAGIFYYHNELAKMSETFGRKLVYYIGLGSADEGTFVDLESAQGLPPKQEGLMRVVAVGCTHQFHDHVHFPPDGGDILIHAGDLGYEESRSLWATKFERARDQLLNASAVKEWLDVAGVPLGKTLKWLQAAPNFKDKVLVGGNHDFILEQLDMLKLATELCELYGITYLRTEDVPKLLRNNPIKAWGSGMSALSQTGGERAIKSGNMSFQVDAKDEGRFKEATGHVGEPGLIVMHGPPADPRMLGKAGKDLPGVTSLLERTKPKLFVCAHAHNPDVKSLIKGRTAMLNDVTRLVNCACLGTWNQAHGTAVVVDLQVESLPTEAEQRKMDQLFDKLDTNKDDITDKEERSLDMQLNDNNGFGTTTADKPVDSNAIISLFAAALQSFRSMRVTLSSTFRFIPLCRRRATLLQSTECDHAV